MKNQYIQMFEHMQKQGAKYNPPSIVTGTMTSPNTLKVGELQVDSDNLLVNDTLALKEKDRVAVMAMEGGQTYIILCKVVKP